MMAPTMPGRPRPDQRTTLLPIQPPRRMLAILVVSLLLEVGLSAEYIASADECVGWAQAGECKKNPTYMMKHCKTACENSHVEARPVDQFGEVEQCAGWADQGECTRNAKFMLTECPKNCAMQREAVYEALLDDVPTCMDTATEAACAALMNPAGGSPKSAGGLARLATECAGSCAVFHLCEGEAFASECHKALRCRELKDVEQSCAAHVQASGCDAHALKNCYLSCARHDRAGLLAQYRNIVSVRTRRYGLLDEDGAKHGHLRRAPGSTRLDLPCWRETLYDEPSPATCENNRLTMLLRWRKRAEPRCKALSSTTPRAGRRRTLPLAEEVREQLPEGHEIRLLPVLREPKVRLVENLITPSEAEHVIQIGTPRMRRSLAGGRTESVRTSSTAMLPGSDPIVRTITQRMAYLSGYPEENIEPLQLVKYTVGQKYEPHFDYGAACDYEENLRNGHRHVTMLIYLTSLPDEYDAHTQFPKLSVQVPKLQRGEAAWAACVRET